MPIYQSTGFFELRGRGWSESYYSDAGSITDLNTLLAQDVAMWNKRALCLGKEATLIARRTSFVDIQRDTRLSFIKIPGNPNFSAAEPQVCLQIRFYAADSKNNKLVFLRGIDDSAEVQGGQFAPDNAIEFQTALTGWRDVMLDRQHPYGWMGVASKVTSDLLNYTTNTDGTVTIQCGDGAFTNAQLGKKVQVSIAKADGPYPSRLNGRTVVEVDGQDQTLCTTVKPLALFPRKVTTKGSISRWTPTLFVPIDATVQQVGTRKTGKISYVPRGRRTATPRG